MEIFFDFQSYELKRNVKVKKTCCFYGSPLYLARRNCSWPILEVEDTYCKELVCLKRWKFVSKITFYFKIFINYCPAELKEVVSILVFSASCISYLLGS